MILRKSIKDALLLLTVPLLAGLVFAMASLSWGQRYEAEATLLYGTQPDYVTQAVTDSDGESSRWTLERILNTETEILNAEELKRDVIRGIDLDRLLGPAAARSETRNGLTAWLRQHQLLSPELPPEAAALQVLRSGLEIKPVKNSGIIHVAFAHRDKALSVEILRRVLDGYMKLRRKVLQANNIVPLRHELERQQGAYRDLLQKRASLTSQYRISDAEQDRHGLDERQSSLISEAGQLDRQVANTNKQLEIHEALGGSRPEKVAEINAERAGLLAAKASVESQLGQVRDERERVDQASSALGILDQDIEARKATLGKLQEMLAAAELSSSLSEAVVSPRILEAPRSGDSPGSPPPLVIAGLAAIASLIVLIAIRLLTRKEGSAAIGRPALSPLGSTDADQAGPTRSRRRASGTLPADRTIDQGSGASIR
jgi:uncharacterized protein involved in exopolysaccharide biosynthesis